MATISGRDEIVKNIIQAREEFRRGEVKRGPVDYLLAELEKCNSLAGPKNEENDSGSPIE